LLLLIQSISACTSSPPVTTDVAHILDDWETQIPTSAEDIEAYYKPLPPEYAGLHVSSRVWPSFDAYREIELLTEREDKQSVIDALSVEFLSSRYPRRNRAIQLLEQIDDRDWGQHFYPSPSFE